METLKQTPARFEHSGIALLIKTRASIGDKIEAEAITAQVAAAKSIMELPKIGRDLVRMFVVGWEGVTADGKPVPFNYGLIYSAFPAELTDTLMPALYQFILANVDILKPKE